MYWPQRRIQDKMSVRLVRTSKRLEGDMLFIIRWFQSFFTGLFTMLLGGLFGLLTQIFTAPDTGPVTMTSKIIGIVVFLSLWIPALYIIWTGKSKELLDRF